MPLNNETKPNLLVLFVRSRYLFKIIRIRQWRANKNKTTTPKKKKLQIGTYNEPDSLTNWYKIPLDRLIAWLFFFVLQCINPFRDI